MRSECLIILSFYSNLINVKLMQIWRMPNVHRNSTKVFLDVNGYASTNMQLFYMLKSYDYIILDIFIFILYHIVCILT